MVDVFHISGHAEQIDSRNYHATFQVETSSPYPHTTQLKVLRPATQSVDEFTADLARMSGIIGFKAIVHEQELVTIPKFIVGFGEDIESFDQFVAVAITAELDADLR